MVFPSGFKVQRCVRKLQTSTILIVAGRQSPSRYCDMTQRIRCKS